ncbi:cell wall-binding repeat-containing protein [Peptostreptococcus faecalis]|uniref:cell wall-binding repeat-containing protein n=1 Tax=Peptostreptococcus faecalis TaxID=2045015 RepID=UPI000C7C27AC|nr:cell wall-binding repeat-containing protein [Peptostreptococcus faecalis]
MSKLNLNNNKILSKVRYITIISSFIAVLTSVNADAISNRVAGVDRYDTSVEISKQIDIENGSIVIANGDSYVDALSGSILANSTEGRILLSKKNQLPKTVDNEINRVKPNIIYILGGENSISHDLENEITNKGYNVVRIQGRDRYETSEKIAWEIIRINQVEKIAVTSNEADTVSASPYCGNDVPIVLVDKKNPNLDFLNENSDKDKVVFGGVNSISEKIYNSLGAKQRISGEDRYKTALEIAKTSNKKSVFIVNGRNLVDALSAGPLAYKKDSNILLIDEKSNNNYISEYIKKQYGDLVTLIGGKNKVPDNIVGSGNENTSEDKVEVKPTDRTTMQYWDFYNKYSDEIILNENEINEINKYNIKESNYLNNLRNIGIEKGVISKRVVMKKSPDKNTSKDPSTFNDYSALTGLFPWDEISIIEYNKDKTWAYVYSIDYKGWIPTSSIMKVEQKKIDEIKEGEFITFIDKQIKLDDGYTIDMGTYLPIIKEEGEYFIAQIPVSGSKYNTKEIKIHKSKAVRGYMEFTQKNIISQALKFQGEKYGWGHSNNTRDCSGFIRDVYRSFGLVMARDTSAQPNDIVGKGIDFSKARSQKEKENLLINQRPGTALYMEGHVMMYLGVDEKSRPMMIHQYGTAYMDGKKVNKFKTEISDVNLKTTRYKIFLECVYSAKDFQKLK